MKRVAMVLEVMSILGLLALATLCIPFMVLWLTWKWSKTRKCGR